MALTAPSWAPRREIQLIAGTPQGGGQDRTARAVVRAIAAADALDVPVAVHNVPGRGGGNGWDRLLDHRGNGHVLAVSSPTLVTNLLLREAPYDHAALTSIAMLYTEYLAFLVPVDSPLGAAAELVARLGSSAPQVTFSFATKIGNVNHIALGMVAQHAGADAAALPLREFTSARHAVADVLAGKGDVAVVSAASAVPELAEGALRPLAVSAPQRLGGHYADAPTWRELSVACVIGTWRGIVGPPELTDAQVACWEAALQGAVQTESWRTDLDRHLWVPTWLDPGATVRFCDDERIRLGGALAALGLSS
jgi:putative tricarboxylic transport membrane protein